MDETLRGTTYDSRPDTYDHILKVQRYLGLVIGLLLERLTLHDHSKLHAPEVEMFDVYTPKLAEVAYGTPEYEEFRQAMGEALEHHYAANSHHPEHFESGIRGMSLLDLIEMLCDWKAASERHTKRPPMPASPGRSDAPQYDSNIERSIALNQERFGYGGELRDILLNTASELGMLWGRDGD